MSSAQELVDALLPNGKYAGAVDNIKLQAALDAILILIGDGGTGGLEHGTQVLQLSLDDGIRPSAGQTGASWNNDLAAIRFDHYGAGLAEADHGISRFPLPQIGGYSGGDITFRVYYSLAVTGDVSDAAKFRFSLAQLNQGDELPADYDNKYITVVDLEAIAFDTLQYFDMTIPALEWDRTKEKVFGQLERMNSDVEDTFSGALEGDFDHRVYVHGMALVWTGWGIPSQLDAPV